MQYLFEMSFQSTIQSFTDKSIVETLIVYAGFNGQCGLAHSDSRPGLYASSISLKQDYVLDRAAEKDCR